MRRFLYIIALALLFLSLIFVGLKRGEAEEVSVNASVLCLSCIGLK